jgi:hypothetical protein
MRISGVVFCGSKKFFDLEFPPPIKFGRKFELVMPEPIGARRGELWPLALLSTT